jgi:hypothetical protein
MKKLLILIVAGALTFHFYPNEKLNNWLLEQKNKILKNFSDATDTKIRLKSDKIRQDMQQHLGQFTTREKAYLTEITASRQNVKSFYSQYCGTDKQTANLHRDNVKKVCQAINKYSHLL